jgi:hypothetical protein
MTATYGRRFSVGRIIRMAYRMARLASEHTVLQPEQVVEAQDYLETILDSLPAEGGFSREVDFETVTLVAGTYQYTLSSDILMVEGDGRYVDSGGTGVQGELLVRKIMSDAWQDRGVTGETGRPREYYLHRAADAPQVWVYPTPEATGTIRFLARRLLADANDTAATPDVGYSWTRYLMLALAADLVTAKLGAERARDLRLQANEEREKCLGHSIEDGDSVFVIEFGRMF